MASAHAAKDVTAVANLKLGRSDQFIVCRLLRFWDSKNIKKQGEFMGITILLLDAKVVFNLDHCHKVLLHLVLGQMHDLSLIDVGGTVNASQISPIGDLGTFLGNTEAKDPLLSCKARIVDIIYPNGWFTISCGACEQPLLCSLGQQECTQTSPRCVVRYQIELLVDDGQNYVVFTLGDKDILGLINQEASSLLNQESSPFTVVGISEVAGNNDSPGLAENMVEEGN
ncbi:unnamed protein product [Cochlearia groenlandica]